MNISIVIPVHNEAENILPLLEELETALKTAETYEIIYVNDGSTDDTGTVLSQAMKKYPKLRVLKHPHSCGQSTAIYSGIKAATFSWIATLDGDGQNDPADIPNLYRELTRNRETLPNLWMVAGWRNQRHDSNWRLFSSRFANGVRSRLLKDNTPDTGCGLKVFSREKFLELPYFDHMHRFLPALIIRAGGKVLSIPVNHRARVSGRSNYGTLDRLWVGIIDLLGVIWLQKRAKLAIIEEIKRG